MNSINLLVLFLFTALLLSHENLAQSEPDTSKIYRIELDNENEYIGTIIKRDSEKIIFNSNELGEITIEVRKIKSMAVINIKKMKDGEYWFENPQATRYFWAPTGYGLRRGESYYQNVWLFFNQFSFGITDNTSFGIGTIPLFLIAGASTPVWITPKISIPIDKNFHLGGGALIGTVIGEDASDFGIAYGTTTLGSRDKNINFGMGYGYAGNDWANTPTITISGMVRTGKRGYFISENYLIDTGEDNLVLISLGGRTVGKKVSLDYGIFMPFYSDLGSFIALPWLGISVPLNKKNK